MIFILSESDLFRWVHFTSLELLRNFKFSPTNIGKLQLIGQKSRLNLAFMPSLNKLVLKCLYISDGMAFSQEILTQICGTTAPFSSSKKTKDFPPPGLASRFGKATHIAESSLPPL